MNKLDGIILAIETKDSVSIVDVQVANRHLTATILGSAQEITQWKNGQKVSLYFSEMEVAIAKNLEGQISLRNRLLGIVTSISRGDLLTRVTFDIDGHAIHSVITTRSANTLQLQIGDSVEGLIKSNEMNLQVMEQL